MGGEARWEGGWGGGYKRHTGSKKKRDITEPVSCIPLNKQPRSNKAASYCFNSVNQISLCGVYANNGVALTAWRGVMK